ncbi:hypothetical protein C8T65DRAFT_695630 [Cerioporus squamosus]|nr:hypothetical protein C8T65DRAFT_695630 [Cerioporus squamosus]
MKLQTFVHVERDPTFWFFDGNIVVIAQGNVAFRVHQGVLALRAEFFAGMFQHSLLVPHGPSDEETIDGCPIIPLDDTTYDIRQLLLVMYGQNRLKTPEETTFPVIAALIRVGDKYGVHDLVDECMSYFRQMRPISLRSYKSAREHRSAIKFAPHHAVEALHICRIVDPLADDEPDILIWMLFLCAQLDELQLRNGTAREDGTLEKLSDADIEQILMLKRELQRRGARALEAACDFGLRPAVDDLQCNEQYHKFVVSHIPEQAKEAFPRGDPFESWIMDKMFEAARSDWMCSGCFEVVLQTQLWMRKDCWDELPTLAGVTGDIEWASAKARNTCSARQRLSGIAIRNR